MAKKDSLTLIKAIERIDELEGVTAVVDALGKIVVRVGTVEVAEVDIDEMNCVTIYEDFSDELDSITRGELLVLLTDISSKMPLDYEDQYEIYVESIDYDIELYLYISDFSGNLFFASGESTKLTEEEINELPSYILEGIRSGLFKKRQVI